MQLSSAPPSSLTFSSQRNEVLRIAAGNGRGSAVTLAIAGQICENQLNFKRGSALPASSCHEFHSRSRLASSCLAEKDKPSARTSP